MEEIVHAIMSVEDDGATAQMSKRVKAFGKSLKSIIRDPNLFARLMSAFPRASDAFKFSNAYSAKAHFVPDGKVCHSPNPLWDYFNGHTQGRGIWKWQHYFEIYHRHFAHFVGRKVDVLEIGIYSGGSLEMWHSYFGEKSHIYGVDIAKSCKEYECDYISIFIGDQADRHFWKAFVEAVDGVDILIDDGGHSPEQQQITLEEMLPRLRPGGVYICEDIHNRFNGFIEFATGLVRELNNCSFMTADRSQTDVSQFQSAIHSIHFYPFVMVIEKHLFPLRGLSALKQGTEWKPGA
jgi:hypothetical protein